MNDSPRNTQPTKQGSGDGAACNGGIDDRSADLRNDVKSPYAPRRAAVKSSNEQLYFDTLKKITRFQSADRLRKGSGKEWGLPFEEALEYAYENVIVEAERAVRGKRRPR